MPVTKVTPSAWAGYTGRAIRQLSTGRLLAFLTSASKLHVFDSDDNGVTWTRRTAAAGITMTINAVNGTPFVSEVQSDSTVWVHLRGTGVSGAFVNYFAIVGADGEGDTQITEVNHANTFFNAGRTVRVNLFPAPAPALSGEGWISQARFAGRAYDRRTIPASGRSIGGQGSTLRLAAGLVDWTHTGDGRTNSSAAFGLFGRFMNSGNGSLTGDLSTLTDEDSQERLTVEHGIDEVSFCDGTNVWCKDDAQGVQNHSRLVRIAYNRLSQGAVSVGQAGQWQAFAHYQGTALCMHSNGGKVYALDTATSTFGALTETHADFASTSEDWHAARYPTGEVLHLLSGSGSYYRIVLNAAPGRPTLTAPAVRATDANLPLSWTFADPDNHTQQSYELRRRTGSDPAWEYWNGAGWQAAQSAATVIAHTTQEASFGPAQWRDGALDHWFGIRVSDHPAGAFSEWSADTRVVPAAVTAPVITAVGQDQEAPFSEVAPLLARVSWTAVFQEEFRVRTYEDDNGSRGPLREDSGWIAAGDRDYDQQFGADGETGFLLVSVKAFGSAERSHEVAYAVDLPSPPGVTTIAVGAFGSPHPDRIRVTGQWPAVPASDIAVLANLHRRRVGTTGDGVVVARALAVENHVATFDDWRVASGVAYEYRWEPSTALGGTRLDAVWTS